MERAWYMDGYLVTTQDTLASTTEQVSEFWVMSPTGGSEGVKQARVGVQGQVSACTRSRN